MSEGNYYEEYEIDLVEYLYLLYKNKLLIISITLLFMIVSAFASFFILEESYKSELSFLAPDFELITGEKITKEEYINFFQRDTIRRNILNEFYPKKENINYLNDKFKIVANEDKIVNLSFTGSEPEKTANVLNKWFNIFESEVYNYLRNTNNNYLQSLENKKKSDYNKYIYDLEKYNEFKSNINISLLESRLNRNENRLVGLEENIVNINNNIKNRNTELEIVNEQLLNTNEFLVKKESISSDSLNKLKSINPDQNLINLLTTENEFLNPQYINLINRKNSIKQQISVLNSKLKNSKGEIKELEDKIDTLENKIIKLKEKEEIYNNDLINSRKNFQTANNNYNNERQKIAGKKYQINIISKANTNDNPISPNKKLNIAIAGVLGLMFSIFIVFLNEFIKNADFSKYN